LCFMTASCNSLDLGPILAIARRKT
jgi:hypothetical protein